jgi:hypothetical protein
LLHLLLHLLLLLLLLLLSVYDRLPPRCAGLQLCPVLLHKVCPLLLCV